MEKLKFKILNIYLFLFSDIQNVCQNYQQWKVCLKMLNLTDYNSISHLFSVSLKTIDQLN